MVQSYKIKPPLSNLANHMLPRVNLSMDSQRWSKPGQSLVKIFNVNFGQILVKAGKMVKLQGINCIL